MFLQILMGFFKMLQNYFYLGLKRRQIVLSSLGYPFQFFSIVNLGGQCSIPLQLP